MHLQNVVCEMSPILLRLNMLKWSNISVPDVPRRRLPHQSQKTEGRHDGKFVITGGTRVCHKDNLHPPMPPMARKLSSFSALWVPSITGIRRICISTWPSRPHLFRIITSDSMLHIMFSDIAYLCEHKPLRRLLPPLIASHVTFLWPCRYKSILQFTTCVGHRMKLHYIHPYTSDKILANNVADIIMAPWTRLWIRSRYKNTRYKICRPLPQRIPRQQKPSDRCRLHIDPTLLRQIDK